MNESGRIGAYHGSPHTFDAFSMEKIGTGEGAQAYGHGLYFAENPETAAAYRPGIDVTGTFRGEQMPEINSLTVPSEGMKRWFMERGVPESDAIPLARAVESTAATGVAKGGLDIPTLVRDSRWTASQASRPFTRDFWNSQADMLEKYGNDLSFKPTGGGGAVYHVEINAEPEDFLHWDKPLSEQSPQVQEALARMDPETYKPGGPEYDANEPGSMIYHRLQSRLASNAGAVPQWAQEQNAAPNASNALNQAGIKGIRYLDQGSRGAGEGTHNYVVFDDKIIRILNSGMSGTQMMAALTGAGVATAVATRLVHQHAKRP